MLDLEIAWEWRKKNGIFEKSEAVRVFHGPGEGRRAHKSQRGNEDLTSMALDRFQNHYWWTEWETAQAKTSENFKADLQAKIIEFLIPRGAESLVHLSRPIQGVPHKSKLIWSRGQDQSQNQGQGSSVQVQNRFPVREGRFRFWIQLEDARHPGLFLDHEPLRHWLSEHCKDLRVLNCFAYSGSLSVAAGVGGAQKVVTLDLSQTAVDWAQQNWSLNALPEDRHRPLAGDVLEWLPRMKRQGEKYDCIILDPPSFAHGKRGKFSTSQDLEKLHAMALDLLDVGGFLVTSINSSNVSWKKYETDILAAAKSKNVTLEIIRTIDLPETFPTLLGENSDRYLKGWVLKRK